MKKKDKKLDHAYDLWPPHEKKDEKEKEKEKEKTGQLKPRNVSYVDPEEFLDDVPEPVFDAQETKDESHTHEEEEEDKDEEREDER